MSPFYLNSLCTDISIFGFVLSVLVGLYEEPERPPNAVDYIKRYMGAPTGVDIEVINILLVYILL